MWDLLYRIGYRQYFPGENWEIIPRQQTLTLAINVEEAPDYHSRWIWYGWGPWDYARAPYERRCARNRAVQGIRLRTGHTYPVIIRANQAEFDKHPEYFPLIDGKRNVHPQAKLCTGNPDLRKLVVRHALRYFHQNPTADSISMDPSDGGGWGECDESQELGSVSDRALLLANEVAAAINEQYGGKLVGMYAYNYHSPPPTIRVKPNVVISVATAFIKGGYMLDEILDGWLKQGATLGIREYYGANPWDRDLPGRARGAQIEYLKRTIPEFHSRGARFMSAESSDNWGPNGLGYYLAARMLWDVEEAGRVDALIEDFLTRCFGPAKDPMREFYRQIDGSRPHLVLDDQLGRMFRSLSEAKRLADSPGVYARLNDLILYAHYVDLYDRYANATGPHRQAAFETLIRYTYRMRRTMMVHAKALYLDLPARDKSVSVPEQATWDVPEPNNPWKSSKPFTDDELNEYLREGTALHPLVELNFEPIRFSEDLVSASLLQLPHVHPGNVASGRDTQSFYTLVEQAPAKIVLRITGGLIAQYRNLGNVRVELWQLGGASQNGEKEMLVASDRSAPPDGTERTVTLHAKETGLHKITVSDGGDMTRVNSLPGTHISYMSSLETPINTHGRWSLYFYVPKGTDIIGMFGGGSPGTIVDPDGNEAFVFDGRKPGYYSIPVPSGADGNLWKIHHAAGAVRLLTVPPYLARTGDELLLPREVVERDR